LKGSGLIGGQEEVGDVRILYVFRRDAAQLLSPVRNSGIDRRLAGVHTGVLVPAAFVGGHSWQALVGLIASIEEDPYRACVPAWGRCVRPDRGMDAI